ncbi:MAG: hypothetical protein M1409_03675, partial [Actinobacteria bacterium]|nr:hypothetical protein [Actinomycetota bacterium]
VGRTGIFKKFSNEPFIFASYLVRFRPDQERVLPEYLNTFLNTKYGSQDVKRRARISINQSNVSASELQKVEIPLLSINFQSKIRPLFSKAFNLILNSRTLYSQAEQLLLSELGLSNWKSKHELAFVKNFSDTQKADRIDAEYYQLKYDEIIEAVKIYKGGADTIKGQFKLNKKSFKKIDNKQYCYIEIGCVNISDGSMEPIVLQGLELPANAKINFQKSDVLVSKVRPYRGAIGIVDCDEYVGSGAFTVLQENGTVTKETLMVFLRLKPLLDFSLKFNTGTSYPTITDDDILNFPLPKINTEIQNQIKEKITEMYYTKSLSKALLGIAKSGVELAIEKDEVEAENWINNKLEKLDIKIAESNSANA